MVEETVTASKVMGDSANVDDVVPAVMSDTVVYVAERIYINIMVITMVSLQPSAGIKKTKYIAYHR